MSFTNSFNAAPPMPEPPEPPKGRRSRKAKGAPDGPVTKKVVNRNRNIALALALVAAAVVGLMLTSTGAPSTFVVRAKVPVPAGTPIDPASQLEAVAVPDVALEKGAITAKSAAAAMSLAKEKVAGKRTQYPLSQGQQLHPDEFNVEMTLSTPLGPDERLMSIQANVADAVAGQIKAGDHVDVAASTGEVAGVILNDVEVVSVTVSESQYQAIASQQTGDKKDAKVQDLLPGAPVPGIYVVRVKSADAPRLYAAESGATLSLIYRGAKSSPLQTGPMSATTVICAGQTGSRECQ